ncbi:LacI family transcriptional regulator [Nocardioidaceae bacterium]|nr:LacI family transcriptional regulator [Nocardioidaceae bacterium]
MRVIGSFKEASSGGAAVSEHRTQSTPTLATVARLAGVSRQTVSNALNSPDLLRPETLARVQQVISEVGYAPNRAARNLRTRRARLVGMRFEPGPEHTADALLDRFVHTLVDRSADAGLHVLLFSGRTPPDGEHPGEEEAVAGYAELWRTGAVDAFVLTDTYRGNPQAPWLEGQRAPFVAFGRPWDEPTATHPWVDVDGAAGTRAATAHLIERGHRRVAWMDLEPGSRITADRREGWRGAMESAGLDVAGLELRADPTVAGGRETTRRLLDLPAHERPEAVVAVSDTVALGVVQALYERGLTPGRDLAVTGFDDSQSAQLLPGGLTTVRQPLELVAVALVEALARLLDPDVTGPAQPDGGVLLEPTLVVRGSSGG